MKRILYILPALLILFNSCSKKNELVGTLSTDECSGKKVYLLTMNGFNTPFLPSDSTIIDGKTFRFDLKDSQENGIAYLEIKDAPEIIANRIPFVYEQGQVSVNIDSVARVKGTPLNDAIQAFFDKLNAISKKAEVIGAKITNSKTDEERQTYFAELKPIDTEATETIFIFVKDNIQNKVGEFYFIYFSQVFDENQAKSLLELASSEFKKDIETTIAGANQGEEEAGFVGQNYINISGLTPDGKTISLSDYVSKNKLVLIDFWASWCGPCRQEMPNVVQAYNKYKSKGFEIVGVSLDDSKENWIKGIKDLNITWPQMSDLKGWNSDLSGAYQITGIPFTLLVDENGKIIAQNLRGEDLDKTLEQLLK